MFHKKLSILTLFIAVLFQNQSIFAFTIINQTDSEKVLKIQEAYRPEADKPGNLNAPLSMGYDAHEITIPAKSIDYLDLVEPCSVLLVGIVTVEVNSSLEKTTYKTTTSTTCYEPYIDTLINNDWGLVIHNPIINPKLGNQFSSQYFIKKFNWEQTKKQGYGIKCLHPILLEKIDSLDELPEELH